MVKVKYIGSLGTGFVQKVGVVKKGETYNVTESVAKDLLKTTNWEKINSTKIVSTREEKMKTRYIKNTVGEGM